MTIELNESKYESAEVKELIISKLLNDGYGTYAKRFRDFKFIVAHVYKGVPIPVAAMFPEDGIIVLNPALLDLTAISSKYDTNKAESELQEKALDQLSVLIRHELLHFLLVHEKRLKAHLEETDPNFEQSYRKASIHKLANYAMDYDISNLGYDNHDKEVVRLMTLNGEVVGGLIAADDHPEWATMSLDGVTKEVKKSMEEMFDILRKDAEEQAKKMAANNLAPHVITIKGITHSNEYTDMYNKVIQKFGAETVQIKDVEAAITAVMSGQDII